MKFAIRFFQGCRILTKADEIIIRYNEKTTGLIDFVQEWQDTQRIVADVTELETPIEECANIFKAAYETHKAFAVLISTKQNYKVLIEKNIPFFFAEGVSTYDELVAFVAAGVSDIYVINELGFNLKPIHDYCVNKNVKVRVYPNVAQSNCALYENNFKKFFIRPDAVKLYEDVADIFEFYGPLSIQPVLYDIYYDERWLGNLNEVILDLDLDIDNRTIMPYFDVMRLKCNKRCSLNSCDICGVTNNLGQTLKDKELGLKRKRAEHEYFIDEEDMWTNTKGSSDNNVSISEK